MTDPNPSPDAPKLPPNFKLKPSRNQKKRSKLQQAPEETISPVQPPEPVPPAAADPAVPAPLRKNRLKRSGQMHEDLTKPLPESGASERPSEY